MEEQGQAASTIDRRQSTISGFSVVVALVAGG